MSGVDANQAGQTPVDSHSQGDRPGEVRPKTSSPDIQQRETIARLLCRQHYANRGYSRPGILKIVESDWQAFEGDAEEVILALRSNPQPGSEWLELYGQHLTWCGAVIGPPGTPCDCGFEIALAAAQTPPTAQPGEVERLRAALVDAQDTLEMLAADDSNPYPMTTDISLSIIDAALTPKGQTND